MTVINLRTQAETVTKFCTLSNNELRVEKEEAAFEFTYKIFKCDNLLHFRI